ncbi:hypothetical protein [Halobacillus sp. Marseille-P3879]|uniref:hypothetical protein n=1 Tax=Halobacillus sp. Marseille-P3879 TaxID=2045014 RepID=UPI000C7C3BCA|nr:hypothetical protein [Halobacillus sp. Marseille-P3879]
MSADIWMVILTGLYVFLTYLILKSNKRMIEETKNMTDETKIARNMAYRPEVIGFFKEENKALYFEIKNIGSRVAFDCTLSLEPGFNIYTYLPENDFMDVESPNLVKRIKVLAPDQRLEQFVGDHQEILKHYKNSVESNPDPINNNALDTKLVIRYFDYEGNCYSEEYEVTLLDYNNHKGVIRRDTHDLVNEIIKLNNTISELKSFRRK